MSKTPCNKCARPIASDVHVEELGMCVDCSNKYFANEDDSCDEPMPESIYWLNPNIVACRNCNYRNAYFDCGHELEHSCLEWSNN